MATKPETPANTCKRCGLPIDDHEFVLSQIVQSPPKCPKKETV